MKKSNVALVFVICMFCGFFSCKKTTENPKGNIKVTTTYTSTTNGCASRYLKNGTAGISLYKFDGTLVGAQKSSGNNTLDFGMQEIGSYYLKVRFTEVVDQSCYDNGIAYLTSNTMKMVYAGSANTIIPVNLNNY